MTRVPLPDWLRCEAAGKCKNDRKCRHKDTCPLHLSLLALTDQSRRHRTGI